MNKQFKLMVRVDGYADGTLSKWVGRYVGYEGHSFKQAARIMGSLNRGKRQHLVRGFPAIRLYCVVFLGEREIYHCPQAFMAEIANEVATGFPWASEAARWYGLARSTLNYVLSGDKRNEWNAASSQRIAAHKSTLQRAFMGLTDEDQFNA
jgi:hypothetical protein